MEQENIAVLSYGSEGDKSSYTLETLGDDFEIDVSVENIAMALCAHHKAVEILNENPEASVKIITVGGCAESNKRIIERINEITSQAIEVEANINSESTATNIESIEEYRSPFIIFCQKFAKLRVKTHSKYHLKGYQYSVLDWETYSEEANFSDIEKRILSEVMENHRIPLSRKLVEGILVVFALIDPKSGLTGRISKARKKARDDDPEGNIFNKAGLS